MLHRLKELLGGGGGPGRPSPPGGGQGSGTGGRRGGAATGQAFNRPSNGLDQFFATLRDRGTLSLLDFAGASQENISFITSLGHRLASEDFVRAIEMTFGQEQILQNQQEPTVVDEFVREHLNFPPDTFDGVLVWDALQFLSPHLLQVTVDRLYETMRPGGVMLGFFNSDEKARQIATYAWRIVDHKTLTITPRGHHPASQYFNNRSIEKLFHRFESVKFFLARDHLREIIVKR